MDSVDGLDTVEVMLSRCWWNFRCKKIGNAVFGLAKITNFDVLGSVYTVHSELHDLRESDDEVLDDGVTMNECMSSNNVDGLCEQPLMQKETEFGQGSDGRSRVSVVSFNGLMSDFCRMGCVDGAKSVLGVMLKYGLHPDIYSYNIMINGLCASGPMEEALGFADDMERNGVEPYTVIYNILLKGLQRLDLMIEAHRVIRQMMQKGLQPDLVTCTTLICGHFQVGNIEEAVRL